MRKNVSGQVVCAQLNSKTDGSQVTTGTTTCYVLGDGGTQGAGSVGSGACTHEGQGLWSYAPAQSETNYDNVCFTFVNTSAVTATVQIYTSFPQTGDSYARLGAPAGASVSADVAAVQSDTDNIQTRLPAALVSGRMDASVGAMASGVVTAAAIATDAIDADALAADAVAEIADGVWDEALSGHVAAGSAGKALGDTDSKTTTIKASTDNLPSDPADQSLVIAATTAIYDRIGAPVGASISADVAAVQADTDNIQTRLPAALVSGRMDASVGAMAANTLTASALATDAVDEIVDATWDEATAGHTTAGTTGKAIIDLLAASAPSAAAIADAVWDEALAGHTTAGSAGAALSAAGTAADPWTTALPGAYGAGTAGAIIGALTEPIDANLVQIDGQATTGNNATLNLKKLNIVNNAGDAIVASSTGSNGQGINASGNGLGAGIKATGGDTAHGINAHGGALAGSGIHGIAQAAGNPGINGVGVSALGITDNSSPITVNLTHIDGEATNDNSATLYLKQLNIVNSAGDAILASSTGSNGQGINASGNGTGTGIKATGGDSGSGIEATGGATSGNGISAIAYVQDGIRAEGGGSGINAVGYGGDLYAGFRAEGSGTNTHGTLSVANGTGSGIKATGGATGHGAHFEGGSLGGSGLRAQSHTGDGMAVFSDAGGNAATFGGVGGAIVTIAESAGNGGSGLRVIADVDADGINASGSGTGSGIKATGGDNGDGMYVKGGVTAGQGLRTEATNDSAISAYTAATGPAIYVTGGGIGMHLEGGDVSPGLRCNGGNGIEAAGFNTGSGIKATGGATDGIGILAFGNGYGPGFRTVGGATADGAHFQGGASSGAGIYAQAQGIGPGMQTSGGVTGGEGISSIGGTNSDAVGLYGNRHGLYVEGAAGDGIKAVAYENNAGINASGNGTGSGIKATGGDTGHGLHAVGGVTSGDGVRAEAPQGTGIVAVGINQQGILASGQYGVVANATNGDAIIAASFAGGSGINAVGGPALSDSTVDAILDRSNGIETGLTLREALRVIAAAVGGKLSGAATTTITIRNAVADDKDRMVVTVDADGNRSAITYDLS